ncbi:MAG: YciI family protein [Boseongicola sp.]
MVAWANYRESARERGALALELFVVQSTPGNDPEAVKANLSDHLAYQRELEKSGRLVLAGPMSDESGEHMMGTGLIIYRASTLQEASEIADNDPMHRSGARTYALRKWLVNEGSLNISVGLSTGNSQLR